MACGIGQVVPGDHWLVKGRESLFEPVETAAERVEQATAAPGERRVTGRPRKTTS